MNMFILRRKTIQRRPVLVVMESGRTPDRLQRNIHQFEPLGRTATHGEKNIFKNFAQFGLAGKEKLYNTSRHQ